MVSRVVEGARGPWSVVLWREPEDRDQSCCGRSQRTVVSRVVEGARAPWSVVLPMYRIVYSRRYEQ